MSKRSKMVSTEVDPADDVSTQAYDNMSQGGGSVTDEELMTLQYNVEPATNDAKTGVDKQQSQASDTMPTQVIDEFGGIGGKYDRSAEAVSPSLSTAPTQVFEPSRSQSQSDGIATQSYDVVNSRQSNSQTEFLATQVFDAISVASKSSSGSPNWTAAPSNSQAQPATQVFGAAAAMERKSDGSPGSNSRPGNCQIDLLSTQVFVEPAAVAATQRRSRGSPQQSTQTFSSAAGLQQRTSGASGDAARASFSPQSYPTQQFPGGDADFPHLALEMSGCSDTHEDYSSVKVSAAQVSLSARLF